MSDVWVRVRTDTHEPTQPPPPNTPRSANTQDAHPDVVLALLKWVNCGQVGAVAE